jgi:hypothetical protein
MGAWLHLKSDNGGKSVEVCKEGTRWRLEAAFGCVVIGTLARNIEDEVNIIGATFLFGPTASMLQENKSLSNYNKGT